MDFSSARIVWALQVNSSFTLRWNGPEKGTLKLMYIYPYFYFTLNSN